ncbi:hypothetical protein D1872_173990 [compost metagenome]
MKVPIDAQTITALLPPDKKEKERINRIQRRIDEIDKEIKALRNNSSINPKQRIRMISQLYMEKVALQKELRKEATPSEKKTDRPENPNAKSLKERKVAEDPNKPLAINFKV